MNKAEDEAGPGRAAEARNRRVLGVDFFTGTIEEATERAVAGGLVVAPSAPGLGGDLVWSETYRRALTTADLVMTDSGWMVLCWRFFTGERLVRHSGLKLMTTVLAREDLKAPGAIFWVMPSAGEAARNLAWLRGQGFAVTKADSYVAPHYGAGPIMDEALRGLIETRRPKVVMLAIGGGVQERLGLALRDGLTYRPGILCLGAAIAFLSGGQVAIPDWADRLYLGWLFRLVASPRTFWRRLWVGLRVAPLIWRYRDKLPDFEKR